VLTRPRLEGSRGECKADEAGLAGIGDNYALGKSGRGDDVGGGRAVQKELNRGPSTRNKRGAGAFPGSFEGGPGVETGSRSRGVPVVKGKVEGQEEIRKGEV